MSISLKNVSYSYKGKFQTVKAVDDVFHFPKLLLSESFSTYSGGN